jgi:hypothetical protein
LCKGSVRALCKGSYLLARTRRAARAGDVLISAAWKQMLEN